MLMHGAGRAGAKQNLSSREYAGRLNSGAFHPLTIRRRFPRSEMTTGEIAVHDLLNFMEAARAEPTTYMVSVNKRVCLCVTSMDGLAIRQGLSYDDQTKKVWGLNSGPFGIEKAEKLNAMDDEQLRRHFVDDPMASEINECMIATANNAVASNLFWSLKKNGGGATTIYDDISNGVPVIACFETLLQAHRTGGDIHTAEGLCDNYCAACATAEQQLGLGHTCAAHDRLPHWGLRRCSYCVANNKVCYSVVILCHNQDSGAPANTAITRRSAALAEVGCRARAPVAISENALTMGDDVGASPSTHRRRSPSKRRKDSSISASPSVPTAAGPAASSSLGRFRELIACPPV